MRLRAGSRWLYPLTLAVAVIAAPLLSAGCGGGSSSPPIGPTSTPTATPTPTPPPADPVAVKSTIIWGPRLSRQQSTTDAVSSLSSAISAIVTLAKQSDGSTVFTQTVNRTPDVELGGRKTYTSDTKVAPGVYNLNVRFYSSNDGTGTLVGTAGAGATLNGDGSISTTIATVGVIQKVTIPDGQIVHVGETKSLSNTGGAGTLLYEPRDKDNNLVALPTSNTTSVPATLTLTNQTSVVPGQPSASVQGDSITGLAPNRASIRVSIDGATSAETQIIIRSNVSITVTPPSANVSIESQQQFLASVQNDGPGDVRGVTWEIKEGSAFGSIDANGLYTSNRNEGPITIVARSKYDPDITKEVPVTLGSLVSVAISPNPAPPVSIKGGTLQFSAVVSNVPAGQDTGVTWSVDGGDANGTVDLNTGLYTAPVAAGTYTVRATSIYDPRKSSGVAVTVTSLVDVKITQPNPIPSAIPLRTQIQFGATVTGVAPGGDTGVTWTVDGGDANGMIDASSGLYTAPASLGANGQDLTIFVRATSHFDTSKVGTATFKITSQARVVISPLTKNPISINESLALTAVVSGIPDGQDTGVTWSVVGGDANGTISDAGVFKAPPSVANPNGTPITVKATSKYDATKSATVVITVQSGSTSVEIR